MERRSGIAASVNDIAGELCIAAVDRDFSWSRSYSWRGKMIRYFAAAVALAAVLASPAQAQSDQKPIGILKICKVGVGIPNGTPFDFALSTGQTAHAPSGPPPGGSCSFPDGISPIPATVTVTETTPGYDVTNITLEGGGTLSSVVLGPNGSATVSNIGPGVSVLTFTNKPGRVGYLEICKLVDPLPPAPLDFGFNIPGAGSVTVASSSCSPPIKVPTGLLAIPESGPSGYFLTACIGFHAGLLQSPPCTVAGNTVTVQVAPGGIQDETLLLVLNQDRRVTGAAARPMSDSILRDMLKPRQAAPPK
jgi:hypothetical protein